MTKIEKIIVTVVLIHATACQTANRLKPDYRLSAIEANFPSAEIHINANNIDRIYNGVASVAAPEKGPFLFSVAGIYNSTVSVRSDECNFKDSKTVTTGNLADFSVPRFGKESRCLISILVEPKFTPAIAGEQEWRAITGMIAIRFDRRDFTGQSIKIHRGGYFSVFARAKITPTKIFLTGCGVNLNEKVKAGFQILPIGLGLDRSTRYCVVDGFAKSKEQDTTIQWLAVIYDAEFSPLPSPEIEWKGENFLVTADPAVSFLSFGENFVFSNTAKFNYHENEQISGHGPGQILRGYTSAGRVFICEVKKGEPIQCFY